MKFNSIWHPFALTCSLFFATSTTFAVGKEEPSCVDNIQEVCFTQDQEVLAFRKAQIRELYQGLVFPGPIEVMKDPTVANHLFQEGYVRGRVTPLGTFTDFNGVVEYFYALAANPQNHVTKVELVSVLGDEDQVSVNASLVFCKNGEAQCPAAGSLEEKKATLTETGIFKFNKQNKIIYFDLIIPNLGAAQDVGAKEPLTRAARIAGVCAFLTVGHVDPITQQSVKGGTCTTYFDQKDDFGGASKFLAIPNAPFLNCVAFMGSIPYGSYDRANSNTFTCRQTHALLTPLRPEYHCQHVAYNGGGKCVDFTYESFYEEIKAAEGEHVHTGH
ncbi:MAG: hypothetical protein EOP48_00985 [Sphingobacteriales bacterium]|nr:MAG: hypothetical protein EOP48_00985 [Sphingobacteriales bacterium]